MDHTNIKYQPGAFGLGTIMAFMLLYSPYIISVMAVLYSVLSFTISGIVYLGFVIFCCAIGSAINYFRGSLTEEEIRENNIKQTHTFCPPYLFFINNNPTLYKKNVSLNSIFFGFTFGYLLGPMFHHGLFNYQLLSVLLFTSLGGGLTEYQYECIAGKMMTIIWVITWILSIGIGLLCANIVSGTDLEFYFIGDKNKWICSQPNKKQQLKCRIVPKNKFSLKKP